VSQFTISQVSQFIHAPRTTHIEAIDRILRFLKGTPRRRILMKKHNSNIVCGYIDADWAESFDKNFTIGYCIFVYMNIVTWNSNKQNIIARSSAEAVYRAITSTTSKLIWIKQLLCDLNITIQSPMKLFSDNQAAKEILLYFYLYLLSKYL
jgi:hypothetical protein